MGGQRQQGYALVLVLWLISMLTFVAGASYNAARTEIRLTASSNAQLEGEALAQAGIWLTLNTMLGNEAQGQSRYINTVESIAFENRQIRVTVRDLSSLININTANEELLTLLISPSIFGSEDSADIVQNIIDWVDSDSDSANARSEEQVYRAADVDYLPKNQPFSSVDELRLVAGMTDRLYRSIAPYLTVFGEHTQINSLSTDDELVRRLTDTPAGSRTNSQRYLTTAGSNVYILESEVNINGNLISNSAIIALTGRRLANAYRILAWQSSDIIRKSS